MGKQFYRTLATATILTASSCGILWSKAALAENPVIAEEPTAAPTSPVAQDLPVRDIDSLIAQEPTAGPTSPPTENLPVRDLKDIEADLTTGNSLSSESQEETDAMGQVTSVSQLRDVQPTDWAFGALQSLVERYGCIEGYPDRTYRGNRAMTRYEFAAGLNQCLNQIRELISSVPNNGITKEDLERLERLQTEFASELANLRNRVDSLEARTTILEKQQFSTTTKLYGQVITYLADAFGDNAGPANHTTLSYQAYLTFASSFTGKDSLNVTLEAGNIKQSIAFPGFSPADITVNTASPFPEGRLGGATYESLLFTSYTANYGQNSLGLTSLQYKFPIGDTLRVTIDAFTGNRVLSAPITPFSDLTTGAVSYYGRINPMLYPIAPNAGFGLQWAAAPWMSVDFYYGAEGANNPGNSNFFTTSPVVAVTGPGGLFNGGYSASVRPVITLGKLKLTGSYINSYSPTNGISTFSGSNASGISYGSGPPGRVDPVTGSIGMPVVANTYVGAAFYRFSPGFEVGTSVGYSAARSLGEGVKGDAEVWDYRINLAFYDLGKKGNLGGLIFGTQPKLTGTSNSTLAEAIGYPAGQRKDRDTGFHIEAFYSYRVNDNIVITPGVFWLTAPNHDDRNPDVVVGVLRTSFSF